MLYPWAEVKCRGRHKNLRLFWYVYKTAGVDTCLLCGPKEINNLFIILMPSSNF